MKPMTKPQIAKLHHDHRIVIEQRDLLRKHYSEAMKELSRLRAGIRSLLNSKSRLTGKD